MEAAVKLTEAAVELSKSAVEPDESKIGTVKASNFVILLGENIFLWQTFLRLLHDFFRYWSLYSSGLGIGKSQFGLGHCLGSKLLFFLGWRI
jgi:hypothetical protein